MNVVNRRDGVFDREGIVVVDGAIKQIPFAEKIFQIRVVIVGDDGSPGVGLEKVHAPIKGGIGVVKRFGFLKFVKLMGEFFVDIESLLLHEGRRG